MSVNHDLYQEFKRGFVDYSLLILIEGNQNSCAVVFLQVGVNVASSYVLSTSPQPPPPPSLTSLLPCSIRTSGLLQLGLKREKKLLPTPLNEITVCQ